MRKYILEPTDENLERLKKVKGNVVYWYTKDFYLYDPNLEDELSIIFDAYWDAVIESDDNDDETIRKIQFPIAKMIINAAKKVGISPQDFREQFDNYSRIIWLPICIWSKDEFGELHFSLCSSIPKNND